MSDGLLVCLPPLVGAMMALAGGLGGPYWVLFVLATSESLVLAWYRRFPLAALIGVTGIELVLAVLEMPILVGVLVAATGLGAWATPRRQRFGLAFVLGALVSTAALSLLVKQGEPVIVASVLVILAVLVAGFVAVGRLGARQRVRIRELRARSRRLEAERELAEQRAAERERALLARELHDILNHTVTAIVLDAEAAADTGQDVRLTLRRVANTGRESLGELRRLLGVLRADPASPSPGGALGGATRGDLGGTPAGALTDGPDGHDPLSVPPGLDQLDDLVRGRRVRLRREGEVRPVDTSIELAAYRIVQESLTNAARHAGDVEVDVTLAYLPESLSVRIVNAAPSGPGPARAGGAVPVDGSRARLGLIGMRERVELLGGSLRAGPVSGPVSSPVSSPVSPPAGSPTVASRCGPCCLCGARHDGESRRLR